MTDPGFYWSGPDAIPEPTSAPPGTKRRVQIYADRYSNGEQLHHPDDVVLPRQAVDHENTWGRWLNGIDMPRVSQLQKAQTKRERLSHCSLNISGK